MARIGSNGLMDLELKNLRAIVCSGSRGIGFSAAQRLVTEGASVVIVGRSEESLTAAAATLRIIPGAKVDTVAADLATPTGRDAIVRAFPDADVLVTHAGTPQRPAAFESLSREDWNGWFDAHFHSAIDLIRAYVGGMKQRRFGRIVNVSANFIKFPQVNNGHSHAARLALAGAIAALVRELAPFNITINSILPGLVDTEALRDALRKRAAQRNVPYGTVEAEVVASCPADRIAQPEEIGDLIATCASPRFGFMTGQNIVVDGGAYPGLF
jgi:3-oxoacyl-[acyl-carrier protein] reductase